jgi:hypothetical protein
MITKEFIIIIALLVNGFGTPGLDGKNQWVEVTKQI